MEDIWQIRITKDGLEKIVVGKEEPESIDWSKIGKTKYERHFLNPNEDSFEFHNNGKMKLSGELSFLSITFQYERHFV